MINFDSELTVMISISPIDFRAGINKLAAIAHAAFDKDTKTCGQVFVFRNKRNTDIKLIGYDGNGFFLGHKRLSKGKLKWWPRTETESLNISAAEWLWLLKGVDPRGSFHPDWRVLKADEQGFNGQRPTDNFYVNPKSRRSEGPNPNQQPG